jgi:hypothetical protein
MPYAPTGSKPTNHFDWATNSSFQVIIRQIPYHWTLHSRDTDRVVKQAGKKYEVGTRSKVSYVKNKDYKIYYVISQGGRRLQ